MHPWTGRSIWQQVTTFVLEFRVLVGVFSILDSCRSSGLLCRYEVMTVGFHYRFFSQILICLFLTNNMPSFKSYQCIIPCYTFSVIPQPHIYDPSVWNIGLLVPVDSRCFLFLSLYIFFYKVKIDRAMKGNTVTGNLLTTLWPLTFWPVVCSFVIPSVSRNDNLLILLKLHKARSNLTGETENWQMNSVMF